MYRSATKVVRLLFLATSVATVAFAQVPRKHYATKSGVARSSAALDMSSDSHFQHVLDNREVRVFRLTLAPSEATGFDVHNHDYLLISLARAILKPLEPSIASSFR